MKMTTLIKIGLCVLLLLSSARSMPLLGQEGEYSGVQSAAVDENAPETEVHHREERSGKSGDLGVGDIPELIKSLPANRPVVKQVYIGSSRKAESSLPERISCTPGVDKKKNPYEFSDHRNNHHNTLCVYELECVADEDGFAFWNASLNKENSVCGKLVGRKCQPIRIEQIVEKCENCDKTAEGTGWNVRERIFTRAINTIGFYCRFDWLTVYRNIQENPRVALPFKRGDLESALQLQKQK